MSGEAVEVAEVEDYEGQGYEEEVVEGGLVGLPVEVQQYVVSLLVGGEKKGALYAAMLTCRLWHLLAQEDMVWRKYAMAEWDIVVPRRSSDHSSEEENWLMLSFRRWRKALDKQSQTGEGGDGDSASSWKQRVKDIRQRLAAEPELSNQWIRLCVEKGLRSNIRRWNVHVDEPQSSDSFSISYRAWPIAELAVVAIQNKMPLEILKLVYASQEAKNPTHVHPYISIVGWRPGPVREAPLDAVPLLAAVHHEDQEAIDFLIELGASPYYPEICSPLHYAVTCGASKGTLHKLLQAHGSAPVALGFFSERILSGSPDEEPDSFSGLWLGFQKQAPLMEACASGNLDAMEVFLAWIATKDDVAYRLNRCVDEEYLVWVAVESLFKFTAPPDPGMAGGAAAKQQEKNKRLWKMMEMILEMGADPNLHNAQGQVLLTQVMEQKLFLQNEEFRVNLLRLLLDHKARPEEQDGKTGDCALHAAVELGQMDLMKLLLDYKPCLNVVNIHGRTPIHEALMQKKYDFAQVLEAAGADMHIPDLIGLTPEALKRAYTPNKPAFDVFSLAPPSIKDSHHKEKEEDEHDDDEVATSSTFSFSFNSAVSTFSVLGTDATASSSSTSSSGQTPSTTVEENKDSVKEESSPTLPAPSWLQPAPSATSSLETPMGGLSLSFGGIIVAEKKDKEPKPKKKSTLRTRKQKEAEEDVEGKLDWKTMLGSSSNTINYKRKEPAFTFSFNSDTSNAADPQQE